MQPPDFFRLTRGSALPAVKRPERLAAKQQAHLGHFVESRRGPERVHLAHEFHERAGFDLGLFPVASNFLEGERNRRELLGSVPGCHVDGGGEPEIIAGRRGIPPLFRKSPRPEVICLSGGDLRAERSFESIEVAEHAH